MIRWLVLLAALTSFAHARQPELLSTQPAATQPAASQPRELVTIQAGDLPIILSAPHGGRLAIPNAPVRTGQTSPKKRGAKANFTFAFDRNVDVLTLKIADEIQKRTGKRPYVVIANFSRRFVDANRDPIDAYESPAGQAVYDEYHGAIERFRKEINVKWHGGLLLDVHGHGNDPDLLIRGTADFASVTHLIEAFGKDSIVGEEGLLGPIAKAGYVIRPLDSEPDGRESPALNGGFITRHYGSFAGGNFDAIQFELGNNYRTPEGIDRFAPVCAEALCRFIDRYVIDPPASQPATRVAR